MNKDIILFFGLLSLLNLSSCSKSVLKSEASNPAQLELYGITPDRPFKLSITNEAVKFEDIRCLDSIEFREIYEYVINEKLEKSQKLKPNFREQNCNNIGKIVASKEFSNAKIIKVKLDSKIKQSQTLGNINLLIVQEKDYFEITPLDTFISNINEFPIHEYCSFIFFTKLQLENMKTWKQIEEVDSNDIAIMEAEFKSNQELIKLKLSKNIPPLGSPYKTNERMNMVSKELVKLKINAMASNKRYKNVRSKWNR